MRPLLLCLLLALLATACRSTPTPSPDAPLDTASPQESPLAPVTDDFGKIRVIQSIDWSDPWGVSLIGVDTTQDHAVLQLVQRTSPPRFAFDVITLSEGQRLERWEASPPHAEDLVNGYPSFRGMDTTFTKDLARYARLMADIGPWETREASPPLSVLPDPLNRFIIYGRQPDDGRDGDWLMIADAAGNPLGRIDDGIRASYHPNFSPDGAWLAWIGGSMEYAPPGRQVGYVLRLADMSSRNHRPVPQIGELLRTPIWSKDSRELYAMGRKRNQKCLFQVNLPTLDVEELLCHDTDVDLMLSPSGDRILMLLHAARDGDPQQLVLMELESGEEISRINVSEIQGLGAFGVWLDEDRFALLTHNGAGLSLIRPTTGEVLRELELGSAQVMLRGRHGAQLVNGELILLRHFEQEQRVELVGITLR